MSRRARDLRPQLDAAIARVLDSGRLLLGPELEAFEHEWAEFAGGAYAIGVGSGTDALRLTLAALDIGPGDEVLVPGFTAICSAAAVCATGATPVSVDVDAGTAAMDPDAARAALTPRTRAAIVVHLYGRPAPIPDLGVPVIEDAAQAHGALRGVEGIAATYSFYPTKNLGGIGDAGAVVTDDEQLARRVARLRFHGCEEARGPSLEMSTNSRLSEVGAAALRVGLPALAEANARRAEIATAYREAGPGLRWHSDHPDHVHHLCVARVEDREEFRARMPFDTAVHYPRAVVDEPAYASFRREDTPRAREWASLCVSFPCYPELTPDEIDRICQALS